MMLNLIYDWQFEVMGVFGDHRTLAGEVKYQYQLRTLKDNSSYNLSDQTQQSQKSIPDDILDVHWRNVSTGSRVLSAVFWHTEKCHSDSDSFYSVSSCTRKLGISSQSPVSRCEKIQTFGRHEWAGS